MNGMRFIRPIAAVMVAAMSAAAFIACDSKDDAKTEQIKLVNHMTQTELERTKETEFQLLNKPWESQDTASEQYSDTKNHIYLCENIGAIVYGNPIFNALPHADYDGGAGEVVFQHVDITTGVMTFATLTYQDYDDLKAQIRAEYDVDVSEYGLQQFLADEDYEDLITLYDAVIGGSAEAISQEYLDGYMDYYYSNAGGSDDSMYWDFDEGEVDSIKDHVKEYHFYDEELDAEYVVHVTTPPSYDSSSAYPALVLTDAVWRFRNVPELYHAMENGTAEPAIMITIGFAYDVDGWDNEVRGHVFCDCKEEYLDFITDNMMPYLNETYLFDFDRSTLFGHSQGGVFSHYAAFNYDRYENKPFKNYLIGSPAFWTPYFVEAGDYDQYQNEYGCFDRVSSYDRNIFITGGDDEDVDYESYYGDNDSTLEGVEHLAGRLESHGVTSYMVKLYDSHHYQYLSDMLLEYCSNGFSLRT